jgi:hypothetical protein
MSPYTPLYGRGCLDLKIYVREGKGKGKVEVNVNVKVKLSLCFN